MTPSGGGADTRMKQKSDSDKQKRWSVFWRKYRGDTAELAYGDE